VFSLSLHTYINVLFGTLYFYYFYICAAQQVSVLRGLLLLRLGRCGHKPTIEMAQKLFKQHVDDGMNLHPDLRRAVIDKLFLFLFISHRFI
jgi:hypothetical protein